MPWDPRFRKPQVTGVTARAIEVVIETGDSGPVTPIGINLPNDQAIREHYGSKSVSLANVNEAYERSTPEGMRTEFSWDEAEAARAKRWGAFAQELTTEMHEVIGHGSGRMADDVTAPPHGCSRNSTRRSKKRAPISSRCTSCPTPSSSSSAWCRPRITTRSCAREYEYYTRTALVQLRRVREGTQLEEDHMRNRQMIVHWLRAHTSAIDVRRRDGKTYFVMTDASAFRDGVGRLLAEVQRIKSEGDYAAARRLFEELRRALRSGAARRGRGARGSLKLPSYTGVRHAAARADARRATATIVDVEISYPCDLETQMLEYSRVCHERAMSD